MRRLVLTAMLVLSASTALAQQAPLTLEQQEALQTMDRALSAIDELLAATTKVASAKRIQCMKAFGHATFCECIAEKSPVGVSFIGYVRIVSATKSDLNYEALSREDKALFDAARATRDTCVGARMRTSKRN